MGRLRTGRCARSDGPVQRACELLDPRFAPFAGRGNIGLYYEDLLAHTHSWGGRRSPVYFGEHGAFSVHTRSSFVFRPSGKLIDFPMVAFFKQHAGLVTDYEEYWDTGYMLKQLAIPAFPVRLGFLLPERR